MICIVPYYGKHHCSGAQIWDVCNEGITQFYLPPTNKPYLPLLPSHIVLAPFGWYSLHLPTKGWPGWVDLGGWSWQSSCCQLDVAPTWLVKLCNGLLAPFIAMLFNMSLSASCLPTKFKHAVVASLLKKAAAMTVSWKTIVRYPSCSRRWSRISYSTTSYTNDENSNYCLHAIFMLVFNQD